MANLDPQSAARSLTLEALAVGKAVRLGFGGGSMSPLLRPGDAIRVGAPPARLRAGDVVLYLSGDVLVAHRVIRAPAGRGGSPLLVKGDFTAGGAEFLPRSRVLGLVLSRERNGEALDLRSPPYLFLGRCLALASPWAVGLGLLLPRPVRRGLKRLLFRLFQAPSDPAGRPPVPEDS
ncbi:MAG: S24/S26 family peptidase [Planctomycetota bacterium]|jgi:hypothetical protein